MIKKYLPLLVLCTGTVCSGFAQTGSAQSTTQKLNINTAAIEYAPTISADGKTMVFQSNRDGGGFRLYESQKQKDGTWAPARALESINSLGAPTYRIGGPSLSSDGKTLYFCAVPTAQNGHMDIYYSEKNNQNEWNTPRLVGTPISTPAEETFPSISPDGKKLFFTRISTPEADACPVIMYSELDERNQWQTPQPLPATINSGCAKSPHFAYNNQTLFFSKQEGNQYRLYHSNLTGSNTWSTPVLCSYLSNTHFTQALYPAISSFEDLLYYTYEGDLYTTTIPAAFRLHGMGLSGTLTDEESGAPVGATLFLVDSLTQDTLYTIPATTPYTLVIPANGTYRIAADAKGYHPYTTGWYTPSVLEPYRTSVLNIALRPFKTTYIFQVSDGEKGLKAKIKVTNLDTQEEFIYDAEAGRDGQYAISLREGSQYQIEVSSGAGYTTSTHTIVAEGNKNEAAPIAHKVALSPISTSTSKPATVAADEASRQYLLQYSFNSYLPDSASSKKLDRLAALLKQRTYSYKYVEISGHTDAIGSAQYNLYFSQKRAQEVAAMLQRKGIPADKIKTKSYGKSKLLNIAETEEAHQQNRRVEIKIVR
jgi:outer membrane protein OmpA-like peptidoglycan-associated protein